MADIRDWLKSGAYLPDCLKDFHDQKDVFKVVGRIAGRREWHNGEPDWMTCHIYVIDVFLWFMAQHGYTLQRSRLSQDRRPEFRDLQETIREYKQEAVQAFWENRKQKEGLSDE